MLREFLRALSNWRVECKRSRDLRCKYKQIPFPLRYSGQLTQSDRSALGTAVSAPCWPRPCPRRADRHRALQRPVGPERRLLRSLLKIILRRSRSRRILTLRLEPGLSHARLSNSEAKAQRVAASVPVQGIVRCGRVLNLPLNHCLTRRVRRTTKQP
jgi:hypothetical protein